jgi:protein-S-isoprenylcysteine O-methyltransferase Ste14
MAEDSLFRGLAALTTVAMVAISVYHRHRADKVGGRVSRDEEPGPVRVGLSLSGLMGFGGLVLYLLWPGALAWTQVPVPLALRWVAFGVAAAAVVFTFWIFRTLGHNVTRTVRARDGATLVTTGPYRFVRHPLYVNGALAFAAISGMTRSWWFVAWVVPALVLLAIRTRQEETHLASRFADQWRAYAARTGRFLPRFVR